MTGHLLNFTWLHRTAGGTETRGDSEAQHAQWPWEEEPPTIMSAQHEFGPQFSQTIFQLPLKYKFVSLSSWRQTFVFKALSLPTA